MGNPWKERKKEKPNPFLARSKKRAMSPWAKKLADQRQQAEDALTAAEAAYEEAFKEERIRFKKLDKLDKPGKRDGDRFREAKESWDRAWRSLDAKYRNLTAASARMRMMGGRRATTR